MLKQWASDHITPQIQARLHTMWEVFNIAFLGLNSYLLLYHHSAFDTGLRHVILSGAGLYAIILLVQLIRYWRKPEWLGAFQTTKKVFRSIYTALYLTGIMINVCALPMGRQSTGLLLWYGIQFCWAVLWGTNCFWLGKATKAVYRMILENKSQKTAPAAENRCLKVK